MELCKMKIMNFPVASDGKEPACNARVSGLIAGLGRSPEEGNGTPLVWSSYNLLLPPVWDFSVCKITQKIWLRMLSIAHEKELKVLDYFRAKLLLFCPI